jgi:hypothetical protein
MENINIKSQKELFERVKPALRCKKHEMMAEGIEYVSEMDIWNYNKNNKWKDKKGLSLSEVVDDILNTPNKVYKQYVLDKLNTKEDVI